MSGDRRRESRISEELPADVPFEILTGVDERGPYVQLRGTRLRQITVEPRADNVVRVREAPR